MNRVMKGGDSKGPNRLPAVRFCVEKVSTKSKRREK